MSNNELIAEFLGHELEETLSGKEVYAIVIHNNNTDFFYPNELQYDTDWNWLMKAVDKIENLNSGVYQVDIMQEGCQIKKHCKLIFDFTVLKVPNRTTKLEATYLAIVEFIKWYNK